VGRVDTFVSFLTLGEMVSAFPHLVCCCIGSSYTAFAMLSYSPSITNCIKDFIMKGCFCIYWDDHLNWVFLLFCFVLLMQGL
jgi:hypothetical protein